MADRRRNNRAWVVLGVLFGVSVAMGVLAYWRFIVSDRYLRADLIELARQGQKLSVQGCVDATLSWSTRCRAMTSLCDAISPEIMGRCLQAQNRTSDCKALGERGRDTHFGYKECKQRGLKRKKMKICAAAHRAIVTHCDRILAPTETAP